MAALCVSGAPSLPARCGLPSLRRSSGALCSHSTRTSVSVASIVRTQSKRQPSARRQSWRLRPVRTAAAKRPRDGDTPDFWDSEAFGSLFENGYVVVVISAVVTVLVLAAPVVRTMVTTFPQA
jgi:hypothetical protein